VTTPDQEPLNPFLPPAAELDVRAAPIAAVGHLASRWQRFGGSLVDGLLGIAAMVPCMMGLLEGHFRMPDSGPLHLFPSFALLSGTGTLGWVSAGLLAATAVLQWTLLVMRGQTVGKMVAGTRVVRVDGTRAGFGNVVALRTWTVLLVGHIPKVNGLISLIDILFIFREDRRCLHDLVADTKVVDARAA
jgi:uncharacterized RDD family membrane protein YckC